MAQRNPATHHRRRRITADALTAKELARIRREYLGDELTLDTIARRYCQQPNWVTYLATRHGWPKRARYNAPRVARKLTPAGMSEAKVQAGKLAARRRHAHEGVVKSAAEWAAEQRQAVESRERDLYGDALDAVEYLRQHRFVVFRERGGIRVDNKLVTPAELKAIAERERRLAEAPA